MQILTDDTARENYRKYGNPDGPGSYSVGIALPRILLQKENHIIVLLSAFFLLLVVIPGYIWYSVGDSLRLDEFGINVDNRKIFGAFMNENMLLRAWVDLLGRSMEMQSLRATTNEEVALVG